VAKKFIDMTVEADRDSAASLSDGTALTLTGDVRVLYDDTVPKSDLIACIDKVRDRINELEG
jgi:hypothetical protein